MSDPTTEQVRLFLEHGDVVGARVVSILGSPFVKRVGLAAAVSAMAIGLAHISPDLVQEIAPLIARL